MIYAYVNVVCTMFQKKRYPFIFLNNSIKNELISRIVGTQNLEEI